MRGKSNSNTGCLDISVYSELCTVHTYKQPIQCFADQELRKLGAWLGRVGSGVPYGLCVYLDITVASHK